MDFLNTPPRFNYTPRSVASGLLQAFSLLRLLSLHFFPAVHKWRMLPPSRFFFPLLGTLLLLSFFKFCASLVLLPSRKPLFYPEHSLTARRLFSNYKRLISEWLAAKIEKFKIHVVLRAAFYIS